MRNVAVMSGGVLLVAGLIAVRTGGPWLVTGVLLLVAAAIFLARPIAGLIVELFSRLLLPEEKFERPMPMYGIPETQRKNGHPREAFDGFQAIAENYPQELKAYVRMIDIAVVDLRDEGLAASVYHQGMRTLESKETRESLESLYRGIRTLLRPATPSPRRVVPLPPGDGAGRPVPRRSGDQE